MKWTQKLAVASAVAIAQQATAHSIFTTLYVNEVSQGDGTCVRMNPSGDTSTDPIPDLHSPDMACGIGGAKPVAFTCPAPAGSKLTFQWRLWANAEQPGVIDKSHKGPCAVYAKQVDNMETSSAAGKGWIKLWHEGYNEKTKKWCTEKLIEDEGLLSFNLPAGMPGGNWLIRPELLALQNVVDENDPQFYTGCAQVFVESSVKGPLNIPAKYNVAIPGHVSKDQPGTSFNVYEPVFPYPIPGPDVFNIPAPVSGARGSVIKQTVGIFPAKAIAKNGNWAGMELPSYSTEDGCWKATEECWKQTDQCYKTAPVTGSANCEVFEEKCTAQNAACEAGRFKGPEHSGQKLRCADPPAPDHFPPAVNADQVAAPSTGGDTYPVITNPGNTNGNGNNNDNEDSDDEEEDDDDVQDYPTQAPGGGQAVTVTVTVTKAARATGSA